MANETYNSLLATGTRPAPTSAHRGLRIFAAPMGQKPIINAGGDIAHDPASITKLMTFYLVCRAGKNIPATITISQHAWDAASVLEHTPGYAKHGATRVDTTIPFSAAVQGMLTASDNVVSNAIAETLGRPGPAATPYAERNISYRNFVDLMNKTASNIGMKNTHFANPSGLPLHKTLDQTKPGTSTAADLAKLLTTIYREYPTQAKQYLESSSVQYGLLGAPKKPHHGLIDIESPSYLGADVIRTGAKTGYTNRALHGIAAMVTDSHGEQLAVVVLGSGWTPLSKATKLGGDVTYPTEMVEAESIKGNLVRDAVVHNIVRHWSADIKRKRLENCISQLTKSNIIEAPTSGDLPTIPANLPKITAAQTACPAR